MIVPIAVLALLYVASLVLRTGLAISYSRSLAASSNAEPERDSMTIAQAILSGDPLLESRLAANLTALPGQRFIWLIDDADSEAHRIAAALRVAFPALRLHIESCSACPDAINPKLWKLQRAAELTDTPYFCVLDDDTTLSADSAARLIAAADINTVATGLPCYEDSGDTASGLLAQFVNNNSVFTYLGTSRILSPFTLNGMCYVVRRDMLAMLGNFTPILGELTDDLAVATLVLAKGGRIHQSAAAVRVKTGVKNLRHYVQLMHRWYVFSLLLVKRQKPLAQFLILVLHGVPPLLFVVVLSLSAFVHTGSAMAVCVAVILVRFIVITSILRRFLGPSLHRPFLSVVSELLQPLHLFHALVCRTIRWRSRRYRVRGTGDFSSV